MVLVMVTLARAFGIFIITARLTHDFPAFQRELIGLDPGRWVRLTLILFWILSLFVLINFDYQSVTLRQKRIRIALSLFFPAPIILGVSVELYKHWFI